MYEGQYSITFESLDTGLKKNTWEDWHLIPAAPPMVNPPEAYTNYVDIPGRKEGPLDLSEVLSEGPVFLNTEGSWDLIWSEEYCPDMTRVEAFRTVTQFLHGRRFRITFQEDPDTSYIGRIQVSDPKPGKAYSTITVNYIIQPTNDNPLDVDGSNYTSNSGEIPWYSGPINQNTSGGGGSGSGSGSGGSGSGSTSQYNNGWNACLDAATAGKYYDGALKTIRNGDKWSVVLVRSGGNDGPVLVTAYTLPTKHPGSGDYANGWNEALKHFVTKYYYTGTYYGWNTDPDIPQPHLKNPTQVQVYQRPKSK